MTEIRRATIDKLDAARRQLGEAIRLWLEERDRLAVHTLTMAAFGILNALAEKTLGSKYEGFMQGFLTDYGYREFYELANYLKHADRDAGVSIREPIDEQNEWRIGLCLTIFKELSGSLAPEMGAFHMMSLMTYPEYFRVAPDSDPDIEAAAQCAASLQRKDVTRRRLMVGTLLKAMQDGILDPNADLRRTDHTDS